MFILQIIVSILLLFSCDVLRHKDTIHLNPTVKTSSVPGDADDCAIWIHPENPANSIIIGNDKHENGALYVWDINGKEIFKTPPLNRPVNVDVRYDITLGNKKVDIVACAIRYSNTIKIYAVDPNTRTLIDITTDNGIPTGYGQDTYGFSLYKHPQTGRLFAFVSQKNKSNIHQIALQPDGKGKIRGSLIRQFGKEDQGSYVEGICADDELGFLYCCDEDYAVLKYHADPNLNNNKLISRFAREDGIVGDREGIALYKTSDTEGYLIVSSQGDSTLKVYKREGSNDFIGTLSTLEAYRTDGVAATSRPVGSKFPYGMIVCHNDKHKNFLLYAWKEDLFNKEKQGKE